MPGLSPLKSSRDKKLVKKSTTGGYPRWVKVLGLGAFISSLGLIFAKLSRDEITQPNDLSNEGPRSGLRLLEGTPEQSASPVLFSPVVPTPSPIKNKKIKHKKKKTKSPTVSDQIPTKAPTIKKITQVPTPRPSSAATNTGWPPNANLYAQNPVKITLCYNIGVRYIDKYSEALQTKNAKEYFEAMSKKTPPGYTANDVVYILSWASDPRTTPKDQNLLGSTIVRTQDMKLIKRVDLPKLPRRRLDA